MNRLFLSRPGMQPEPVGNPDGEACKADFNI